MSTDRRGLAEGMPVYSGDGHKVGTVVGCGPSRFEIEKGFFFMKDYLLPYSDVARVADGKVWIRQSRRDLEQACQRVEDVGDEEAPEGTRPAEGLAHAYHRNAAPEIPNDEQLNTGAIVDEDETITEDAERPMLMEGRSEVDDYLF